MHRHEKYDSELINKETNEIKLLWKKFCECQNWMAKVLER